MGEALALHTIPLQNDPGLVLEAVFGTEHPETNLLKIKTDLDLKIEILFGKRVSTFRQSRDGSAAVLPKPPTGWKCRQRSILVGWQASGHNDRNDRSAAVAFTQSAERNLHL